MYQFQQQSFTSQFVEDDLPLPSYDEVFAFLFPHPNKQVRASQSTNHVVLCNNLLVAVHAVIKFRIFPISF